MTALLLLPLPFALPPLVRRAVDRPTPAAALWSVAGRAVLLAGCSAVALGVLLLLRLLKLPFFAALGELVHPLRTAPAGFAVPAAPSRPACSCTAEGPSPARPWRRSGPSARPAPRPAAGPPPATCA